jgi:hypothetical protein
MTSHWNVVPHDACREAVGVDLLRLLRQDDAAVIVFKNLIGPDEYTPLVDEVIRRRNQAIVSQYVNGSLTTFGTYLARHLSSPAVYFEAARAGNELFANQQDDLRQVVRARLARTLGLESLTVAGEPDGRSYAPAIVRIHGNGVSNPLHNDNIMRDARGSGLMLAGLGYQFSCVTCLQECNANGALLQYRRRWAPPDEAFKVPNGLGYMQAVVDGADLCRFRPETGDVYIMDPTNYHAIEAVQGRDRVTMGFFFGFRDDACRSGVCWS